MDPTRRTAAEVGIALDALAALRVTLTCDSGATVDTRALDTETLGWACARIDDAVTALKKVLAIAAADGQGPPK